MSGSIIPAGFPQNYSEPSYAWSLRTTTLSSANETPVILIVATTRALCLTRWVLSSPNPNQGLMCAIYSDPTVTSNGTLQPSRNLRIGANTTVATSRLYSMPTTSSFGNFIVETTIMDHTASQLMLMLEPGHTLLVTANTTVKSNPFSVSVGFSETM